MIVEGQTIMKVERGVPRRSNLFQDVVGIIHRHMAGDAAVEESALLSNRVSGEQREVDVVIRSQSGGYSVVIAVEATSGKRRADAPWVENMLGKHANLPSDKLVLVSEGGFTKQARQLAESAGAVAIAPEDLGPGDPAGEIVNRLRSLWPKLLALTPERMRLDVERPDGTRIWFRSEPDHLLFLADGAPVATVSALVNTILNKKFREIADGLGLAKITEDLDAYFEVESDGPHATIEGERQDLYVRFEEVEPPELHRLARVGIVGKVHIEVREVHLRHLRLGDFRFATGQMEMGKSTTLLVVSEAETGGKLTLRTKRPTPKARQR